MLRRHLDATFCLLLSVVSFAQHAQATDLKVRVLDSAGEPATDVPLVIRSTHTHSGTDLAKARTNSEGIATFIGAEQWFATPSSARVPVVMFDLLLPTNDWLPLYGSVPSKALEVKLPPVGRVTIHIQSVASERMPAGLVPILASDDAPGWPGREMSLPPITENESAIQFTRVGLGLDLQFTLRQGLSTCIVSMKMRGPTQAEPVVDVAVWPSLGVLGQRALVTGTLLDSNGRPVSDADLRVDFPFYTDERGESDLSDYEGGRRTYPARTGPSGNFQIALPVSEHDWKWGPSGVYVDFVDQLASIWCFDDARHAVFEAHTMMHGCTRGATVDLGAVPAIEHRLLLRGVVAANDGKIVEFPAVRLFDKDAHEIEARMWSSPTGCFAFLSDAEAQGVSASKPSPWSLSVGGRHYAVRRVQLDSDRSIPITVVVSRL